MPRNVDEWIGLALAAAEPAEVARCLDAALAVVTETHEARRLLKAGAPLPGVPRAWLAKVADRTLDLALCGCDVWGIRDAATLRESALQDREAARAALDAGRRAFAAPRTDRHGSVHAQPGNPSGVRGHSWVLLGRGYLETLQDQGELRACLEAGLASARAAGDAASLGDIACAWGEHVDRAQGVALMEEAEALPENALFGAAMRAHIWRRLGQPARAQQELDAALAAAQRSDAALRVFRAWTLRDEPEPARRALERARALAVGCADWLEIAEAIFDHELPAAELRAALERAERGADDAELRGRLARGYWLWLRDAEAAARVGPRGCRPADLRRQGEALAGWTSSASDLFDWLRVRVAPAQLEQIARADYGNDATKHADALRDICETGLIPRPMDWVPHEVLALTRWSARPHLDHLARALSCTLLCFSSRDLDELISNGPILAESCFALGSEARECAERLFAWWASSTAPTPAHNPDYDDPEPAIARLLLFMLRAAGEPDDPRLDALASGLLDQPRHSLLELRIAMSEGMREALWCELCEAWLAPLCSRRPCVARVLEELDMGDLVRAAARD